MKFSINSGYALRFICFLSCFDGVLRTVNSGTPQQRKELDVYLINRFSKGACIYDIRALDSALVTFYD